MRNKERSPVLAMRADQEAEDVAYSVDPCENLIGLDVGSLKKVQKSDCVSSLKLATSSRSTKFRLGTLPSFIADSVAGWRGETATGRSRVVTFYP